MKPEQSQNDDRKGYGAIELKNVYVRNLWIAAAVSVGAHLLVIGLYFFFINVGKSEEDALAASTTTLTSLPPPPPPPTDNPPPPPPPPPMVPPNLQSNAGTGGVASVAGNPVPTPDLELAPDAPEFASTAEINVATAEMGDGTGVGGLDDGSGIGVAPTIPQQEVNIAEENIEQPLEEWQFEAGQAPQVNQTELQKNTKYPDLAQRNNIQGVVTLRVTVGKDGRAEDVQVLATDHASLTEEAVKAARKTTYTPGIQNKKPVRSYLTIRVRFEIR